MKDGGKQKKPTVIARLYQYWSEQKTNKILDKKNLETLERFLPFEIDQKRTLPKTNLTTLMKRYDAMYDRYEQYNDQIQALLRHAGCEVDHVNIQNAAFSKERIQITRQNQPLDYYCYNGVMDSAEGLLDVDPRTVSNIQKLVKEVQSQMPEFINGCELSSTTGRFRIEVTNQQIRLGTFLDVMMHQKNLVFIRSPHSSFTIEKIGPNCQAYLDKQTDQVSQTAGIETIVNSIYVFENQLPTYLSDTSVSTSYQKKMEPKQKRNL